MSKQDTTQTNTTALTQTDSTQDNNLSMWDKFELTLFQMDNLDADGPGMVDVKISLAELWDAVCSNNRKELERSLEDEQIDREMWQLMNLGY